MGDGSTGTTVDDHALTTSVVEISSNLLSSHAGATESSYTTYQIILHLAAEVRSVYTIFGTDSQRLSFPPAYQAATPFGVDVGGVNPAFFPVAASTATGYAQFDSWLTVGITDGDTSSAISQIGIDFLSWDEDHELLSDSETGGAVFWMDPDSAADALSPDKTVVIAQLTIPDSAHSQPARFGVQGRTYQAGQDWEEKCISVMVGGSDSGQGTHAIGGSGVHARPPPPPPPHSGHGGGCPRCACESSADARVRCTRGPPYECPDLPPTVPSGCGVLPGQQGGSGNFVRADSQTNFVYHSEQLSWLEAELSCVTAGGHLASVHSDADALALRHLVGSDSVWVSQKAPGSLLRHLLALTCPLLRLHAIDFVVVNGSRLTVYRLLTFACSLCCLSISFPDWLQRPAAG